MRRPLPTVHKQTLSLGGASVWGRIERASWLASYQEPHSSQIWVVVRLWGVGWGSRQRLE